MDVVLTREQIQELIPHRPPFLWLDEVVLLESRRIKARKYVDPALDVFRGHYPHFPIVPGVLLCEAAFQAGAVLIAHRQPPGQNIVPVVTRQNNTRFRRMVRPGETIVLDVELTETLANAFFLAGTVSVDEEVAVRLEFACAATSLSRT